MKKVLYIIIVAVSSSCSQHESKPDTELEIVDTELAEIRGAPEHKNISRQDSIQLLKSFYTFCDALKKEDGFTLARLNTENRYWPSSLNMLLDIPYGFPDFLISWPNKNLYKHSVWSAMNYDTPTISMYGKEYQLLFSIKRHTKRVIVETGHYFTFINTGCGLKFQRYEARDVWWKHLYPSIDSITTYFPKSGVTKRYETRPGYISNFCNVWYSQVLNSCSEPVLFNYKGEEEIYRFSWFRSFHSPVVIRIQKKGFSFHFSAKVLQEGYEDVPDEVIDSTERFMNFFEWHVFKEKLGKAGFWQLPVEDTEEQGMDGAQWVMEGIQNGKYHVVERWSAGSSNFGDACRYLIAISDLGIQKEDIY